MRMSKTIRLLLAVFVIGLMSPGLNAAGAQEITQPEMTQQEKAPILISEEEVTWSDGPETMPPGTKIAILEGDPKSPGPLTMRLKLPANATIAPHTHPTDERFTVLSGTLYFGLGETADASNAKAFKPGSFFVIPSGDVMFAFTTEEETVLQLNVEGPWGITYLYNAG